MSKTNVLIDVATAGASGDMFLSALLDLIGENDALTPVAASLLIYDPTLRVRIQSKTHEGRTGRHLEVTLDRGIRLTPNSLREVLIAIAEECELSKIARDFCDDTLNELFQAECRAHEQSLEDLHLHELGSVDTILDIAGTAYLLEKAGLFGTAKFFSTEVAVGTGTIQTEHGKLEVPVPAVAEILVANDIPYVNGPANTEVLTPTGAAILATLVDKFGAPPGEFIAMRQGVGFGSRDLGDIPNMMRIMVADSSLTTKKRPKPAKEKARKGTRARQEKIEVLDGWNSDEVVVVETTVDDVDGEIMGSLFDVLLSEGLAYDVVMIPAFGKKNRPCFIVKVIAAKAGLKGIAEVMMKHLGTLGVRYTTWERLKASRETIVCKMDIDGREFMVRVKVSRAADGSIITIKPEADDVLTVSKATGISVREI
ncbi:MAG: nickel pincer cofactor biosynthesis protein LarC, partial [Candidatus Thorarchaeota archaeon]